MTPAASRRRRAATYYELIVEGNPDRCQGLLTGLMLGADDDTQLWFSHEAGIRTPFGERLRDFVHLHAAACHVVVNSAARRVLKKHAKDLEAHDVRVLRERKITGARFEYHFHAYAPKYGDEIRALLKDVPRSLEHEDPQVDETVDRGAKGVEVYSPVHDYEIEGKGAFSGRHVDLLIEARRALDEHPLVNADLIELQTA